MINWKKQMSDEIWEKYASWHNLIFMSVVSRLVVWRFGDFFVVWSVMPMLWWISAQQSQQHKHARHNYLQLSIGEWEKNEKWIHSPNYQPILCTMLFNPLHKSEYYVVVVFSFGIASVEPRAVDEDGENRFEAAATKQLLLLQCFLIYVICLSIHLLV